MSTSPMRWIEPVLKRFERPLLQYAAGIVDAASARDVVQETFLKLARRGPIAEEKIAPWLFRVCRNHAIDLRRKSRKTFSMDDTILENVPEDGPSPSRELEKKENLTRLQKLLAQLPQKQQEVLRLRFTGELSYREISAATRLGEGNVGFLLHHAIKTLRELWPTASEETL